MRMLTNRQARVRAARAELSGGLAADVKHGTVAGTGQMDTMMMMTHLLLLSLSLFGVRLSFFSLPPVSPPREIPHTSLPGYLLLAV